MLGIEVGEREVEEDYTLYSKMVEYHAEIYPPIQAFLVV